MAEIVRLLASVSGERLVQDTAHIASRIRNSGEPDELRSFEWIQEQLQGYGYFTQLTHHPAYISLPGPATVTVDDIGLAISGISHAFAAPTGDRGLRARLADGDDPQSDVTGALVLVDGLASGSSVAVWEARGAVGQVHIHDDHLHETSVSPTWGNPSDHALGEMPRTPSAAIRRSDGARLRALLAVGEVSVRLETEVLTEWRPIPLLTARLRSAPEVPYVLLSSHVDSWHYGAMDNGSANATTLEVARMIGALNAPLRRGLKIAFWSGHSHGRFAGSAWYADQNWQDLYDNCVAHVFVDSTGGIGASIVTEPPVMPQTESLAAEVIESITGEKFEGKRIGRFADQSFYGIGVNSIFGTLSEQDAAKSSGTLSFKTGGRRAGGLGWWWHTPDDTIDKVDMANLIRDTRIYLATTYHLLFDALVPFDYRPAIEEIEEVLSLRIESARENLDLGGLLGDVARTRTAINGLHRFLDSQSSISDEMAKIANEALLKISRSLVPIAFHERGRFDRDSAAPLVPVPALRELERLATLSPGSNEAYALAARLHRVANWIRFELRTASEVAEVALVELAN